MLGIHFLPNADEIKPFHCRGAAQRSPEALWFLLSALFNFQLLKGRASPPVDDKQSFFSEDGNNLKKENNHMACAQIKDGLLVGAEHLQHMEHFKQI